MIANALSRAASLLIVAAALFGAAPAGSHVPGHIRTATIAGVRGPVYYSPIDRRFHLVGLAETARVERIAQNLN